VKQKSLHNNIQIRSSENKSRATWDIVKVELGNQKKTSKKIKISVNGVNIQDPKATANVFNEYYTNVAKKMISKNLVSRTNEIDINIVKYNSNSMSLTPTTNEEVIEVIKGMGNKKSAGIDDIPDYVIKNVIIK
jgi:replicative DNA helicase